MIELLDTAAEIKKKDYVVEPKAYYRLREAAAAAMDKLSAFQAMTKAGEPANTLAGEAGGCVRQTMGQIEINAGIFFDNGGGRYRCAAEEAELTDRVLSRLPRLYDEINEEMGVVSPGITHLY